MNDPLTTPSGARLAALSAVIGLLLLGACSSAPGTAPAPATATTLSEVVLPVVGRGDENLDRVAPSRTPAGASSEPTATRTIEPTSTRTMPASLSAYLSPLPSPTPPQQEPPLIEIQVAPGQLAPDFTLHSARGQPITLSDYQGHSNVVLVFYRGQT